MTDSIRNLFFTCEHVFQSYINLSIQFNFNFYSCHPRPGIAKGFIKGEALRLLRINFCQFSNEENMSNFKTRLQNRGYSARIVEKHLSEIKFSDREM